MNTFPHYPVNARSLAKRKPIFGIGINDADYLTQPKINGKKVFCPFYARWMGMLGRCYSDAYHEKMPTYIGCTVVDEWLTFSVFRRWMDRQPWEGSQLDKDILIPGNKIYSAEACVFVSGEVNSLLLGRGARRGEYPQGVSLCRDTGRYLAGLMKYGKGNNLGRFDTPEEASEVYKAAKSAHIIKIAQSQQPNVKVALIAIAENMTRMNTG